MSNKTNFRYDTTPLPRAFIGTLISQVEYNKIEEKRKKALEQDTSNQRDVDAYRSRIRDLREQASSSYAKTQKLICEQDDLEVKCEQLRIDKEMQENEISDLRDQKRALEAQVTDLKEDIRHATTIKAAWQQLNINMANLPILNGANLAVTTPAVSKTILESTLVDIDKQIAKLMVTKTLIGQLMSNIDIISIFHLPSDLFYHICTFLDVESLIKLSKTCNLMRSRWLEYRDKPTTRLFYIVTVTKPHSQYVGYKHRDEGIRIHIDVARSQSGIEITGRVIIVDKRSNTITRACLDYVKNKKISGRFFGPNDMLLYEVTYIGEKGAMEVTHYIDYNKIKIITIYDDNGISTTGRALDEQGKLITDSVALNWNLDPLIIGIRTPKTLNDMIGILLAYIDKR